MKQVKSEIVAPVAVAQVVGPQLRKRKRHEASKLDVLEKAELFMKVQAPKRQRVAVKDFGAIQPQDENSDALDCQKVVLKKREVDAKQHAQIGFKEPQDYPQSIIKSKFVIDSNAFTEAISRSALAFSNEVSKLEVENSSLRVSNEKLQM